MIQIEQQGDIAVIVPTSQVETIKWEKVEQALDEVIRPLQARPAREVVVDLSQVGFAGSAFLSFLLTCDKRLKALRKPAPERAFVLTGLAPRVRDVLRFTGLERNWQTYATREEALAALA